MSRRTPLVLTDPEPGLRNDAGAVPLTSLTRGSESWADLFGPASGLGVPNEQTALTCSAIYASVNLIAGAIASLPLVIYKQAADGERDALPMDDLHWLLNEQMVPRWSAANGWEFLGQSKLLQGDSFARIHRTRNGETTGIEPLHFPRVEPIPTQDGKRLVYVVQPDPTIPGGGGRSTEVFDQDDILHFAGFGFNGVRGLSPLRYALRMAASVALAAQDYSAGFFSRGARPDYVLQTDMALAPEKVVELRAQIEERHAGVGRSHRPMLLSNGLKAETLSLSAEDMQLISTRQFQIEEIARIYGIPPFMIGHNEKTTSWGSGVEAMGIAFVRYALGRHINKFENELNRKLFRTSAKVVKFDTSELESADFKSLIEAYRAALGRAGEAPILSVEEVRMALNLKRTPTHGNLERNPNAPAQAPQPPSA